MALVNVKPTQADIAIARTVAAYTDRPAEDIANALTWGADEKVLLVLAATGWVLARGQTPTIRRAADHALLVTSLASLLPHLLKGIFDQTRPDRLTVIGHYRGVPFSGKRKDAFPSGHAMHMGALASAASTLPRPQRNAVWSVAAGLSLTRVLVLAHWTSDVVVGFVAGAFLERLVRRVTDYPRRIIHRPKTSSLSPISIWISKRLE